MKDDNDLAALTMMAILLILIFAFALQNILCALKHFMC